MEAVGAAAAIAQLAGLSLTAGKLARNVVSSFRHAPAEIIELERKLQHFHSLVIQVDSLWNELPETQAAVPLLSDYHIEMFSVGMQNIASALMRVKAAITPSAGSPHTLRDRMRWAMLDKKKTHVLLKDAQMADSELSIMLQVLTARMSSMNQNSLVALNVSQSMMREDIKESFQKIKAFVSTEMTQLRVAVQDSSTAPKATRERTKLNMPSKQLKSENDPGYMLMQHSMRATQRYTIASTGNSGHPAISSNAFYSIGGSLTVDSRLKSRKAKFLFNLAFRLLGQYILRVEIQAQLLCRFWKLNPSLTGSLWVVNMRPGDAPIFSACRSWNLEEVHYLLNTGQASINDADNETGGLLEHVILGRLPGTDRAAVRETDFLRGGQALLEYLLEQGCDPSITYLRAEKALPAVLSAFSLGYRNATSTMISHGADINSFGNMVGGLFESVGTSTSQLLWKFRLLQSMGYSDWRLDTPSNHLLYGACWGKKLDLSLFALEIASLDPNQPGELGRTPLGNAAQSRWLEGISILIQYGARVNVREGPWDESPLGRSIALSHILTDASHYLLLKGADPGLQDSTGLSLWAHMMTKQYDPEYGWYLKFSYIAFEGSVAHLLHHGSNPFEIFDGDEKSPREYDVSRWFALIGHLQASDIARFRSYGMSRRKNLFAESFNGFLPAGLLQSIEAMDSRRCFDWTFRWDIGGEISWDHNISSATKAFEEERLSRVPREEQERGFYATDVVEEWGSEYDSDDYITDEGNFVPIWEHADPRHQDYTDVMYGGNPEFFRNATGFYRHIATAHGRRQLSRWPTVRALCDALQHAGYRVEMDDEGDLWYDCDDGDRYFDAWERQSAQVRDDWLVNTCPICQNLEKYGLGHILETEMKAKEKISEYRRQAREGKRRYF